MSQSSRAVMQVVIPEPVVVRLHRENLASFVRMHEGFVGCRVRAVTDAAPPRRLRSVAIVSRRTRLGEVTMAGQVTDFGSAEIFPELGSLRTMGARPECGRVARAEAARVQATHRNHPIGRPPTRRPPP